MHGQACIFWVNLIPFSLQHPMEVFKAFRGREPSVDALLRHTGLEAAAAEAEAAAVAQ